MLVAAIRGDGTKTRPHAPSEDRILNSGNKMKGSSFDVEKDV